MEEAIKVLVERMADKHAGAIEELTRRQFEKVLSQAILSGDFVRFVTTDGASQQVSYVPYHEKQRLEAEVKALRTANCNNCKWDEGDGWVCNNPVDQCGKGDRVMWEAKDNG